MRSPPKRRLIVTLPNDAYKRLEAEAVAADRVAAQHAAYLLRRLLEGNREVAPAEHASEVVR